MVLRAASRLELTQQINVLKDFSPDQHLLKAFIQFLQNDYVIPGDWKKPKALHYQSIQVRMLNYLASLAKADDVRAIEHTQALTPNLLTKKIA